MHPLPYEDGLSEDIYHDLFESVGRDESLIQSFFESRLSSLGGKALLAYDSTTVSTYSGRISEARYGFNTPVYLALQWFDAVEEVKVSTKLLFRRWTTEITARDRLFLKRLGVPAF